MASRPTIGDVADAAGVSVATVSRALRGLDNVSADTRKRVESAARKLDYAVDSRASSLASGRTRTIGLVAPYFDSWYASQIVASLSQGLADEGYDLLIYSMNPLSSDRMSLIRSRFRGRRVDAIIFIDLWLRDEELAFLSKVRVPLVTIGDVTEVASSVAVDDHEGGRLAIEHLLELGHRDFVFIGGARPGEPVSPPSRDREAAARTAIADAGLPQDCIEVIDGWFSTQGGQKAFAELAERPKMPSAVICASDEMAIGFMTECWQRGFSIPGKVSVVGFDGHEMAEFFGLTTVDQRVRSKGTIATELVLAALEHDEDAPTEISHRQCELELIVRSSTAAIPS